jgi:hypothetical protein
MSYEEMQQQISLQLDGANWNTFEVPSSIAKAGVWVFSLSPSFLAVLSHFTGRT